MRKSGQQIMDRIAWVHILTFIGLKLRRGEKDSLVKVQRISIGHAGNEITNDPFDG